MTESPTAFEELRRRTDTLLAGLNALSADLVAEVEQERQDVAELEKTEHELGQLLRQLESLQALAVEQARAPVEAEPLVDERSVAAAAEAQRHAEELRAAQAALHAAQDEWIAERSRLLADFRSREQETQAKAAAFAVERASLTTELEALRGEVAGLRSGSQETTELRGELERLQALQQQWELERSTMLDQQEGMRAAQAESEHVKDGLQAEVARIQQELTDKDAALAAQRGPLASELEAARQELEQLPALKEELARLGDQRTELLQHIELVEQYWYQREATFSIERASWRRELDNANFANQEATAELRQTKRRSRRDLVALLAAGLLSLVVGFSLGLVPNDASLPIQPAGAILGMLVAAAFFTYAYRTGMAPARAVRLPESTAPEAAAAVTAPATAAVAEPVPPLVLGPPLRIVPPEPGGKEPAQGPKKRRFRRPVLTVLLLVALVIGLLPIIAILRGALALLQGSPVYQGASWVGLLMAFIALSMGTIFFAYSIKYYLATAVVLLGFGGGLNDRSASRLERIQPQEPDGNWSGGATTSGWLPAGTEPFVSVHIASYNEKRVIERLLAACSRFEYTSYEVIVVDDSTDESTEILERWKGLPRFKVIHRPTRDGFKGGALKLALAAMDPRTQYVVVLDADSIPFPDSIQRLLYHFYQEPEGGSNDDGWLLRQGVGAVQGYQWHVLNRSESWLTQAIRTEYAGSYMIERPFQEAIGSMKMIAGTAYMIRADLLRELGWGRSLTEDWELTLRLYARGYKVVYTPYAETPAECVSTFTRLARQRMRWAEGHTYNVRKWFWTVLRSPRIGVAEKVGFAFYATYYLQALFMFVGSFCWLLSEVVFKVHVPDWTSLMGWSLVISNLLSLPLMNLSGLVMEGAPRRDLSGVLGALATSFLLVPFQAWAAVKGLFERNEGPWFRTPKTGRITDPVWPLRRLRRLRRWLWGPKSKETPPGPAQIVANIPPPRRPARRLAWVMIGGLMLSLGALGVGALHAPVAEAAGVTSLYLHHSSSGASIAFVRSASATETTTANTLTVNISSGAGHLLVAMIAMHGNTGFNVSSITDTAGNTWVQIDRASCGAGAVRSSMWYAKNAAAVTSVTFNLSQTMIAAAYVLEFSGADLNAPLDTWSDGCNTGTAPSSGAITPSFASDLEVGLIKADTSSTFSAGPTFTTGATNNQAKIESNGGASGVEDLITGYELPNSTANQTYSGTFNASTDWSSIIAAFKTTGEYMDGTSPPGASATNFAMTAANNTRSWVTSTVTAADQTIFSNATFQFNYWTAGAAGATSNVTLTFGYDIGGAGGPDSGGGACMSSTVTTIASTTVNLTLGSNLNTATFNTGGSNVQVPQGSMFCYTITVNSVTNGGLTLHYDASTSATRLTSSQTIFIPEFALLLVGIALIAPRIRRMRRGRQR